MPGWSINVRRKKLQYFWNRHFWVQSCTLLQSWENEQGVMFLLTKWKKGCIRSRGLQCKVSLLSKTWGLSGAGFLVLFFTSGDKGTRWFWIVAEHVEQVRSVFWNKQVLWSSVAFLRKEEVCIHSQGLLLMLPPCPQHCVWPWCGFLHMFFFAEQTSTYKYVLPSGDVYFGTGFSG